MQLAYSKKGEVKYLVKPGLELKFSETYYHGPETKDPPFDKFSVVADALHFWNSSPESTGIDWTVAFTRVEDYLTKICNPAGVTVTVAEPGTDLHRAFLGVVRDGDPPEPFLDLLVESCPHLGPMVDKYLGTHNEFPEGKK